MQVDRLRPFAGFDLFAIRGLHPGDLEAPISTDHGEAIGFDGNDFAAALRCYLGQLAMTDHPELAGSAATMCEMTLSHLASSPRDCSKES